MTKYSRHWFTSCGCANECDETTGHCELCGEPIVPTLTYHLYDGRVLCQVVR